MLTHEQAIWSLEDICFEGAVPSSIIFMGLFSFYISSIHKDVASSIPGAIPQGLQIRACLGSDHWQLGAKVSPEEMSLTEKWKVPHWNAESIHL